MATQYHQAVISSDNCRSALKEALATPPSKNEAALAKRAAACGEAANSRLSDIVLQFLRQQHKEACLSAEQPVSTLPPLSLSSPNLLPKVFLSLDENSLLKSYAMAGQAQSLLIYLRQGLHGVTSWLGLSRTYYSMQHLR